ncbi:hypothetical protein HKBW3S42_02323, partial [Candidatus Hakubella thermalkaliphila]
MREGKGDHKIYFRYHEGKKRVVPIDMGAKELSPPYVLRLFHLVYFICLVYFVCFVYLVCLVGWLVGWVYWLIST